MKTKSITKTIFLFATLVLFNLPLVFGQSIKTRYLKFTYEGLPINPFPDEYKTYRVKVYNKSTDGVTLNPKFIFLDDQYIKGLRNTRISHRGDSVNESPTPIWITIILKNIEMIDKGETMNSSTNLQTGKLEYYYAYNLTFKFDYQILVSDTLKNKIWLDTLISTPKIAMFPRDYSFDAFGNKSKLPGYPSRADLDFEYNKASRDLYVNSKMILAQSCLNEAKIVLTEQFGWEKRSLTLSISHVKSKSPTFDVFDTIHDIMNNVMDSITQNAKGETRLNWRKTTIRKDVDYLMNWWEDMVKNEKYLSEFKDPRDKKDFIDKINRNLVAGYLFQDDFDKALKLFSVVEPSTLIHGIGATFTDKSMDALLKLIRREKERNANSLHKLQ